MIAGLTMNIILEHNQTQVIILLKFENNLLKIIKDPIMSQQVRCQNTMSDVNSH